MKLTTMQEKILNTAESLIQKLGYNAFSYKDIALVVGIKTSSIHYYYPTKEDLAVAVIEWQLERLTFSLNELKVDASLSLQQKLLNLVDLVISVTLNNDMKMCLGGMLASDVVSLPEKVKIKVRLFFNSLDKWINEVLVEENSKIEGLNLPVSNENLSKYLLVQLEGGLLLSRLYDDFSYIGTVKQFIKATF
ncbi:MULTISPECIES: TetR/AcrR family transcriptional regulator [Legionella]|uniref:TetR family transcriptional regulator n=1 Tax=Legionella drozanskii LLAP-1 TaxID=1212489 RepID=A0A0W0SPY6_9GAMM|nr:MULTISPECIES: TetR/AcrR family transcriptional regulator [Legionella]KTC85466.1 TetR family transcriptional regulator [Legionella drozanskii LLAP-1]PJE10727.1 MAG: TetR/AcrR family transcriptional regulator [Legionella sp.]